jgi:hypothetical protein
MFWEMRRIDQLEQVMAKVPRVQGNQPFVEHGSFHIAVLQVCSKITYFFQ